jgi:hypothetical protein
MEGRSRSHRHRGDAGACSEAAPTHADDGPTSSLASSPAASSPTVSDTSEAVCAKFREVAAGAFGESMSFAQIVDGLKEVGELGTTAANPSHGMATPSRTFRGCGPD